MATIHVDTAHKADAAALELQGMLAGTTVLTLEGDLPVDYLMPGDRVLTRSGARRVSRIEVTVMRHARVVKIAHDTLGVGKPQDDVTLSAAQGILLRDWRAKALYGSAQAIVAASRLVDGEYIMEETLAEARFYTLVFAEPCVIYAGGLELSCEGVTVRA
ncbi:MAG: Hint domain-containing protein [Cypionkella sp.]